MIEELSKLSYPVFMRGMCNAPFDYDKCEECGGTGLKPIMCCMGSDCGCRGMPVDFSDCKCGCEQPTDEQIKKWIQPPHPTLR